MTDNTSKPDPSKPNALDRLIVREDVLQICYCYQGEGFGDTFTPQSMMPFLKNEGDIVIEVMAELAEEGALILEGDVYRFSDDGKRKAGVMFYESFTELQQGAHGECTAGCCEPGQMCEHHNHATHDHSHHHH